MRQDADVADLFTTEYCPCFEKNAFSSNLEGEGKQKFLSVTTMLEYSYQFKSILIGYAFPNISKIISLYLRPQFHYTFCAGFLYQKMLYIMLQRNIHYIQIISFVRQKK